MTTPNIVAQLVLKDGTVLHGVADQPMPDRFRLQVTTEDGRWLIFPFADEGAFLKHSAKDLFAAAHDQVGWQAARVLVPEDWTPARVRLPLLGDTPTLVAMREIRESSGFGAWLCRRREAQAVALTIAFDHHQDPSDTSIDDAYAWSAHVENGIAFDEGDGFDRDEEDDDFEEYLGMCRDDYFSALDRYATLFIAQQLRKRGFSVTKRTSLGGHEHCEWVEVARPAESGVYFVVSGEREERVKIGYAKSIKKRLCDLQTTSPYPLKLAAFILSSEPAAEESRQHRRFRELRVQGEWFHLDGKLLDEVKRLRRGLSP